MSVTVLDTTAATVHISYCNTLQAGWCVVTGMGLCCCYKHTHAHTHYLCLWLKTKNIQMMQIGLCWHFPLHLRVISCWWSDGCTYEMHPGVSTANGPEISESREPSSLISLTGIKLSLIYEPKVCVINSNEWRQDATGAFLWAEMTPHTHTLNTRTQIYSLTWPRWLKQSLRTGGAQVIRPSLVYQFSCNHFICKHGKVGTVMRHGLSLEACSKTWLFTLFIPAHAHLYSFSFDIFPRFNLIKFCFSCEDLWKRFICQLASCSPV